MAVMKSGEGVFGKAIKSSLVGGLNSNTVGSDNTNLILKGKAIKVLWGNRFIDLIKDGKINVENLEILKTVSDSSSINENGLYLIPETLEVWVCIDGQKINLTGGSYLSFMVELELTPEQKYLTLTNAGFYYQTLAEALNILGGIVYIEDEGKLYIVRNGQLQEYNFQSDKKDEFTIGNLRIYKNEDMTIESPSLILSINDTPYIIIKDLIKIYKDVIISNDAMIQSDGATSSLGFRLYNLNGLSTLEVDNIIEREKYEDNAIIYSKYSNLVTYQVVNEDGTSTCNLLYSNQFEVGDTVYAVIKYTNILTVGYEDTTVTILTSSPVTSEVEIELTINDSKSIVVLNEGESEKIIDSENAIETFSYKITKAPENVSTIDTNKKNLFIFTVTDVTVDTIIINSTLDCTNCELHKEPLIKILHGTLEVIDKDKAVVKIGTLTDEEGTEYSGIYSSCYEGNARDFFFNRYPKYNEGVTYPGKDEDAEECLKSEYNQVVPNIEWIKKLISSYLPIGTIIMYNGSSKIPEDWTICDGSHGSPNLVGKFIKASAGEVGETIVHENNEITLTADNLPKHSHSYTINEQTSTGSISKTTTTGTIANTTSTGSISNTTVTGTIDPTIVAGTIDSTIVTGTIGSTTVTGTISETTSSGTFNGSSDLLTSNVYSSSTIKYVEIINIPKDDKGEISDETIKSWGVTNTAYDSGGTNYTGYISMDLHTHSLTFDSHTHSFTADEHNHTLTIDEHGHTLAMNEHNHTLMMNLHNHTLTMNEHGHTLTMNSHTHTISELEQEWKNTSIKVEPNYYSLIFIMKWK